MESYYVQLSVNRGATEKQISQAYRTAALQNHPERNKGNKEAAKRLLRVSEAYARLPSPARKTSYLVVQRSIPCMIQQHSVSSVLTDAPPPRIALVVHRRRS